MVSVIEVPDSIPVLSPSSLTDPYHSRPESPTGLTDLSACVASDVQVFATHDPAIPSFTEIMSEKVIRESWNDEKREDMMNETVSPVKGSFEEDSIESCNDDSLNSMPKVIQCPSQSINATQGSRGSVMSTNQEVSQATRFQIMVHDQQRSESNWNSSEFQLAGSNANFDGNDGMIWRPVQPSNKNGLSGEADSRTTRKESQATEFQITVHDQQRSESNWNSSKFQLAGSNAKFNGNDGMIWRPVQPSNKNGLSGEADSRTTRKESQATEFQITVHDQQRSESNWNSSKFQLAGSNAKFNGNDGMIWRPVQPSNKNGLSGEGDSRTTRKKSQATKFQIMVHDQQGSESNWNSSEFQLAGSNAEFNGNDGKIWRPVQPSNKNGLSGEGNSRTSRKEWRPKALPSSMTSDVIPSRQENCPEDLHISEKQHVIIPDHLLPPKLETTGLTFGCFDSGFKRVYLANGTGSEVGSKPHGTSDWRLTFDANSYRPPETHGTAFKPLTPTAIDRNDSPTAQGDGHSLFSVPCQNIASLPVSSVLSPQEPSGGLVSNATMRYNYLTGKNVSDSTLGLMKKNDQHAELKERAMWRAKEVRQEEIERQKEQEIRSLTKLLELDKHTRAEEGSSVQKSRDMPAIANQYQSRSVTQWRVKVNH